MQVRNFNYEGYRRAYASALLGIASTTAIYVAGQSLGLLMDLISNFILNFLVAFLFVSALSLARRYGWSMKGVIPKIWVLMSLSAMFLFSAILLWDLHAYVLGVIPSYPSMIDALLLMALVLGVCSLSTYIDAFKEALNAKIIGHVWSSMVVLSIATAYFIVTPILSLEVELAGKLLTLTYIILELTLFSLAVTGMGIFLGGRLTKAWFFLSLSIAITMAGSLIYLYTATLGIWRIGAVGNMCLAAGLILLALAFHIHKCEI